MKNKKTCKQEKFNILYLGTLSSLDSINNILCFYKKGYNITVINNHPYKFYNKVPNLTKFGIHLKVLNLYKERDLGSYWKRRVIRYLKMILDFKIDSYCYDRNTAKKLEKTIVGNNIDLIFAEWGTGVVPELALLNYLNIDIPVVHNILTYPDTTKKIKEYLVDFLYANIIEEIDGLVVPTNELLNHIKTVTNRYSLKMPNTLVFFQKYCSNFFYNSRLEKLSRKNKRPHIIFIGRTDFTKKRPHDDIRNYLQKIAEKKIHVHFAKSHSFTSNSKFLHQFDKFNQDRLLKGKLATFMTQFDGCIMLYNIRRKTKRFQNSLPNRFLFALTAGIPLILPRGIFPACEKFIDKFSIGFSYSSYDDLRKKLVDGEYMNTVREKALSFSQKISYENNFDSLGNFLADIINIYE